MGCDVARRGAMRRAFALPCAQPLPAPAAARPWRRLVPLPVLHQPAGGDGGTRVGRAAERGHQGARVPGWGAGNGCCWLLGVDQASPSRAAAPLLLPLWGKHYSCPFRLVLHPTCAAVPQVLFRVALALLKLHEPLLLAQARGAAAGRGRQRVRCTAARARAPCAQPSLRTTHRLLTRWLRHTASAHPAAHPTRCLTVPLPHPCPRRTTPASCCARRAAWRPRRTTATR